MLYYRRKIILSLLETFSNSLSRTEIQKLLFLFTRKQTKPTFHFIPYKYGCFSLQANQDLKTMEKYNLVVNTDGNVINSSGASVLSELKMNDRIKLTELYKTYSRIKGDELIRIVYNKYPYYAINSEIAEKILTNEETDKIKNFMPKSRGSIIFSVGYEGKAVEEYLNLLIKNDIKIIIDVRKNAFSMKYGFSKKQLTNVSDNLGIKYIHIPELGIESVKRKELKAKSDYIELFNEYENDVLDNSYVLLKYVNALYNGYKRIAFLCFEADPEYCHRTRILKRIIDINNNWNCKIIER